MSILYKKIKSIITRNKKIAENFSYLSILQIFNLLLPLITYPYLIRVLGFELYGTIVFAQAIIAYFSVIVNFGFNISATKDIAQNQKNRSKKSEIISSVLTIQFLLWLLSLSVVFIITNAIPFMKKDKLLYIFTFGITFNELLFPVWYFQGIEKMKFITQINLIIKVLFLVLIFVFVKDESDYLLIPVFNALGAFCGGLIALNIVFIKHKISFKIYPIETMRSYFIDSLYLFISKVELLIKDKSIVIVIGILFNKTIIAYYDLASKIVSLFISLYQIIPTVVLPQLIQQKNYFLSKSIFYISILISLFYYFIIIVFSNQIISILTGEYISEVKIYISIVGLLVIFNPINTLLNYYLIINNKEKKVFKSVTISLIVFISISLIAAFYTNITILLWSVTMSGIIEFIYKISIFKKKYELWEFIDPLKKK
jgi:PST family polysaccharide transporter